MTEATLDRVDEVLRELEDPAVELDTRQTVCPACRYVYWRPLGYCPTCAERH